MNEENANNMNQNASVNPAPVTPEATPAAPVMEAAPAPAAPAPEVAPAPAAPAIEVAPAPVAAPVAPAPAAPEATPAVPAIEAAPAPVTPVAAPSTPAQPAPVAQPEAQIQPVPVTQPVSGGVPVMPTQEPPKKKGNVVFIVIVLVLVLAIVGVIVAFYLNNKSDDTKKDETKVSDKKNEDKKDPEPVSTANAYELGGYKLVFPEGYKVNANGEFLEVLDEKQTTQYRLGIDNYYTYSEFVTEVPEVEQAMVSEYSFNVTDKGEKTIGNKTWYVVTGTVDDYYMTYTFSTFNGGTFCMILVSVLPDYSTPIQTISGILDSASGSSSFSNGDDNKPDSIVKIPKIENIDIVEE